MILSPQATWYAEKRPAKTIAREELQHPRVDVRAGHVRKLYVFRLDRLARSGIRDTFEVVEELHAHGCELVAVADGFDLNGPTSEVVVAVMAWAAKMERLAISGCPSSVYWAATRAMVGRGLQSYGDLSNRTAGFSHIGDA